jgi:hypothetical protein
MSAKKKLKRQVIEWDEVELFFAEEKDTDQIMDDAMERIILIDSCRYTVARDLIPKNHSLLASLLPEMNDQR